MIAEIKPLNRFTVLKQFRYEVLQDNETKKIYVRLIQFVDGVGSAGKIMSVDEFYDLMNKGDFSGS